MKCLFIVFFLISSALGAQEFKCLYYAMNPLTDFKPTYDMDYLISFSIDSANIAEVNITELADQVENDSTELNKLYSLVEKIEVEQIKYCFRDLPEMKDRFSILFSGRNSVPEYGVVNLPKKEEAKLRIKAETEGVVFMNFGIVFYYESNGY